MSKETETKDLITNLCDEHNRVAPSMNPFKRAFLAFSVIVLYNITMVHFFDTLRPNLDILVSDPYMIFEILMAVIIGITSVVAMSLLMVPDVKGHKWFLAVPTTLSFVFLLWIGISFLEEGYASEYSKGISTLCFQDGLVYAGLPTFLVVFLARRGASAHSLWLSMTATLSVISIAWISLRFICSMDSALHIFVDHMLPFALIGFVLGIFSRRLFSW